MMSLLPVAVALVFWEKGALLVMALVFGYLLLELAGKRRSKGRKQAGSPKTGPDATGAGSGDATVRLSQQELDEATRDEPESEPLGAPDCVCKNCHHAIPTGSAVFCERCGSSFRCEETRQQLRWDQGPMVLVVGRDDSAAIGLYDETSSRSHAQVIFQNGSISVVDLGSHNRTWINGRQVTAPTLLCPGDNVQFGRDIRTYDHIVSCLADEIRRRSQS